MYWVKAGALALGVFIVFHVAFHGVLNMGINEPLWAALPPAVLVGFLWTRLVPKTRS